MMTQTLEQRLKGAEDRLLNIENVMSEAVSTGRNAIGIYNRQVLWEDTFNNLVKTIQAMEKEIKSLMVDAKYVELFSNDDIKNFYMNTDLTVKEVKEVLNIHFPDKKDLTIQTIGNYMQGLVPDVHIRSFLGKFLRNEANKKSVDTKSSAVKDKKPVSTQGKA